MKIKEFAEEIRNRISGKIEDVLEIKIKSVLKNNSKKLTAFVFKERVQKVTPNLKQASLRLGVQDLYGTHNCVLVRTYRVFRRRNEPRAVYRSSTVGLVDKRRG